MNTIQRYKRTLLLGILLLIFYPVFCQENDRADYLYGSAPADIIIADLVGFSCTFGTVGLNFGAQALLGIDGNYDIPDQMLSSGVASLSNITPVIFQSPDAISNILLDTAFFIGEYLSAHEFGLFSREHRWFYWGHINLAMYKSYDAWASIRVQSPAWENSQSNNSFERHSSFSLIAAPFNPVYYTEPILWASVGLTAAGMVTSWLFAEDPISTSPLYTGKWYHDDNQYTPHGYWLLHIPYFLTSNTLGAIGEEAVYRGFFYEELQYHFGTINATMINTTLFAAMHIVTDITRGTMSWHQILTHAASVSLDNILMNMAYEEGGLPLAVAAHAASNFVANIIWSFQCAGEPTGITTN